MSVTREQVNRFITRQFSDEDIRELIDRHVESDSFNTGIARARVRNTGVTVATLIQELDAVGGDIQAAADDYDLSPEQVLAAVFFYWDNQTVIDAEITVRNSWFEH